MLGPDLVDVTSSSQKHALHSFVSGAGIFFLRNVAADSLADMLLEGTVEVSTELNGDWVLVFVLSLVNLFVFTNVDTGHSHLVQCQCTCLVRADVSGSTHDFTSSKTLHIVVILKHLFDRVGKGDHNSERETLRNSDHNDSDSDNEVLDPNSEVGGEKSVTFIFSTEEVDVTVSKTIDEVDKHETVDSQKCEDSSQDTNVTCNLLKFLLKWGSRISLLGLGKDFTKRACISNDDCHHSTFSTGATGSREHDWGWKVVRLSSCGMVGLFGGSMLFVRTALHAGFKRLLSAFVTLASHCCFVRGELVASEENTIYGYFLSVLEDDDITDADEVVVHIIDHTITHDLNLIKKEVLRSQEIKLSDVAEIYNAQSRIVLLNSQIKV